MRKSCSARVHIGAEYALGAPNSGKKAAMAVGKVFRKMRIYARMFFWFCED
jgi:hypothetical protein